MTAVSGTLLMLLYLMIFSFSEQDGEESGSLSQMISEKCAELINILSGRRWSEAVVAAWAEYFEHPVRKMAHFMEYACMGTLVYVLWSQWMRQGKRLYGLTVLWVFLSAMGDEIHQLFVPGRFGSLADVLLDTSGGAFGMLCCIMVYWLYRRRRQRRQPALR